MESGDENGIDSHGGALLQPFRSENATAVGFGDIVDGSSNTLLLGEQSDWLVNDNGVQVDGRSDGNHGFNMGTRENNNGRRFNLTVIRHPINEKLISNAIGTAGNLGPNRPIQSAHPGGAMVAACDGSVHFLTDSTDLELLFDLADRDDGNVASVVQ